MRLAVATNRAQLDPTLSLRGAIAAPKTKHRAAITDPKGADRLMAAISGYDKPIVRAGLLIMAYCFPRPGECRLAHWNEVDLDAKVWTVPGSVSTHLSFSPLRASMGQPSKFHHRHACSTSATGVHLCY